MTLVIQITIKKEKKGREKKGRNVHCLQMVANHPEQLRFWTAGRGECSVKYNQDMFKGSGENRIIQSW